MIYEKVVSIICDQLGLDEEDITLDSVLMDIVDDSIDLVELVKAFEDEFNIVVPDEEFENFTTVADVVKYLEDNYPNPNQAFKYAFYLALRLGIYYYII